mmetsp:Transcript_33162/g.72311  ORF Transcript_33162/g.72311 Transcript_33162/m.72311 type:complete len:682 (-) Transcript_33162:146-2191(-)
MLLGLARTSWPVIWAATFLSLEHYANAQQPQKMEPPRWLSDDGKDLFNDLEAEAQQYGELACETREKLLKHMFGKSERDATDHRARVLIGLGVCEFKKAAFDKAKKRLASAISELNLPNEDMVMQNPQLAPYGLMQRAAEYMEKFEVTQAGTALRRAREVVDRNMKKMLKGIHKQLEQQQGKAPPLEALIEELPGYGKSGQILPMLVTQVPLLKSDLGFAETLDDELSNLDSRIAAMNPASKAKRDRLGVSHGQSKGGSLLYARALPADSVIQATRLADAKALESIVAALKEEAAAAEKAASTTLLKRTQAGPGCKEGKGFTKTCAALQKIPDVQSNGFGETRLIQLKAGKSQTLDMCTTNANIGILLSPKEGVTVTVTTKAGPTVQPLEAGVPMGVDFCLETKLQAEAALPVLFAQAWHPEFAAVERTSELRGRAKSFGLSEDQVKAVTKVVNDHAKKNWEKTADKFRKGSPLIEDMKGKLKAEVDEKLAKEAEAAKASTSEEDEVAEEERKKKLEELERKRQEKAKKAAEEEEKRRRRKQLMEEERAKRDPWLNTPEVRAVETKLEELKEARRDANAKLEFEESTQLTKDISAAERELTKTIKKAKKGWKKRGGAPPPETEETQKPAKEEGPSAAALKSQLEEVKRKKKEASVAEEYTEAKRLKKEQIELEEKIRKLEL